MSNTSTQYDSIIANCRDIYLKKFKDYGASWRIFRLSSITDQVYIKANRIRTLQQTGETKVGEGIEPEFGAIINYSIMAQIQCKIGVADSPEFSEGEAIANYDAIVEDTKTLMEAKNHDYGEAWRDMRVSSLVDLILVKLLRIKQIEDNKGKTLVSEGVESNYQDIMNYAIFALILMNEKS